MKNKLDSNEINIIIDALAILSEYMQIDNHWPINELYSDSDVEQLSIKMMEMTNAN